MRRSQFQSRIEERNRIAGDMHGERELAKNTIRPAAGPQKRKLVARVEPPRKSMEISSALPLK